MVYGHNNKLRLSTFNEVPGWEPATQVHRGASQDAKKRNETEFPLVDSVHRNGSIFIQEEFKICYYTRKKSTMMVSFTSPKMGRSECEGILSMDIAGQLRMDCGINSLIWHQLCRF